MFLSINVHSDVPIYAQIARQMKFAIAAGTLTPGQLVPSARAMSGQLTINPNTVVKAFSMLQSDGVIEPLRGRGMVVSRGAVAICRRDRDSELGQRIGEVITEAWNAGLDQSKIQQLIDKHLAKLAKIQPAVERTSATGD
ncbi:GntR family transcriptional regulator [Rubripirellula amarantea]|uniref:HTH-type transcriptional repressor YtrA n=1 Tax=Rubripirellula amarantea TaxID=2527999 RepID=A0A5C5WQR9_9BACT|nr:GntR family transcriptional regulator [Rubripirellula amarantea]MDA8745631.1 GntR family transcriptional regulator [Rubripirellula amarantea]TWT53146.1 HTH-type transcriptional repressor YtrA [Rubripirellula amarantea]